MTLVSLPKLDMNVSEAAEQTEGAADVVVWACQPDRIRVDEKLSESVPKIVSRDY